MKHGRRRKNYQVGSIIAVRPFAVGVKGDNATPSGVMETVLISSQTRQTEVIAHMRIDTPVQQLSPLHVAALAAERLGKQKRYNADGTILRRGLSGGALLEHIAGYLRGKGFAGIYAGAVQAILDEAEVILRAQEERDMG